MTTGGGAVSARLLICASNVDKLGNGDPGGDRTTGGVEEEACSSEDPEVEAGVAHPRSGDEDKACGEWTSLEGCETASV